MKTDKIDKLLDDLNFDRSVDPDEPKLSEEEITQAGENSLKKIIDMVFVPKDLDNDKTEEDEN
jgi:hypothetical protein